MASTSTGKELMGITFRSAAAVTGVVCLVSLVGCERGDSRLGVLSVGIGKDSAIAVMQGQPTVVEPYLVNSQYIEAMFYAQPGKTDSASRAPRAMTPVVFVDGKLIGWGWDHWDSVAAANKIPVPAKAGNRE